MFKYRNVATLLAISTLAALPACSMFGGGRSNEQASSPRQSYASSSPSSTYGSSSSSGQPGSNYSNGSASGQQPELSQDTTRQVQQELQQDGMYKGRVDGVWGPQTQSAVRQYQQQHNLSTSGQLDSQTLASLNVGNDQGGQSSYNNTNGMTGNPNGTTGGNAAGNPPSQRYSNTNPSNGSASSTNSGTSTGAMNPSGSQGGNAGNGTSGQSTH